MLKFYLNKKILVGFVLTLAILIWLAVSSFINTRNFVSSSRMVAHTLGVLYNTERVLGIVTNIELGQRGYTITANKDFLSVHEDAVKNVNVYIGNLTRLTSDNESQQLRLATLKERVDQLKEFSSEVIEMRTRSFGEAMRANQSLTGKALLDDIRQLIVDIEKEEHDLLESRSSINERQINHFNAAFVSLLVATGLILMLIFFAINVNIRNRIETEKRLHHALKEVEDLYNNAPCGYHSLDANGVFVNINDRLLNWLGYQKGEVVGRKSFKEILHPSDWPKFDYEYARFKETGAVNDLEFTFVRRDGRELPVMLSAAALKDDKGQFIKSRATTFDNTERKKSEVKILNLNQELEAFTYSVSHDLRAPLRSIDGYARILQEDYSDKLDQEGTRVLNVIVNNGKRMGKLIDDLLDFARLGRNDLTRNRVAMNPLVENIVAELVEQEKNTQIEYTIHPLATSLVDVDMIRQVWINLVSNAIKYSAKSAKVIIEISSTETASEVVYCIRDNGVGFDMKYSNKLFGVFQRLHRIQDFAGTGVGLAIVRRVIERHGGKVWAEGKVNEGASFYFSIPKI